MNKPIISLILPAYNVAQFIENCIVSCETQNIPISSYEIIVVNDGSTDNTLEIVTKLSNVYRNIKILNQKNQGLSMAEIMHNFDTIATEDYTTLQTAALNQAANFSWQKCAAQTLQVYKSCLDL